MATNAFALEVDVYYPKNNPYFNDIEDYFDSIYGINNISHNREMVCKKPDNPSTLIFIDNKSYEDYMDSCPVATNSYVAFGYKENIGTRVFYSSISTMALYHLLNERYETLVITSESCHEDAGDDCITVSDTTSAIKALGINALDYDVALIGRDPYIFNERFLSAARKISFKYEIPLFGGYSKEQVDKGLAGGFFAEKSSNINGIKSEIIDRGYSYKTEFSFYSNPTIFNFFGLNESQFK